MKYKQDAIITKFYKIIYASNKQINCDLARIYMFHQISQEKTCKKLFTTNINDFESFLENELLHGKPMSIDDIFQDGKVVNSNSFAITFDDAYKGVFQYAFPLLERLRIPFTVFVTVEFLNKETYINESDLIELSKSELCTIGSHTLSHPKLRGNENSMVEIRDSKTFLETLLNITVDIFAYPYGSVSMCSLSNQFQVKKCKYKYAFSAINGYLTRFSKMSKFFLPRICGEYAVINFRATNMNEVII